MTTYNSLTVEDLVVKRLWVEHKRIDTINLGSLVVADPLYNVGIGTENPELRLDIIGTSAIRLPVGNNSIERPDMSTITNKDGIFRYNSSDKTYETYFLNKWRALGGSQLELSTESGVSKSTMILNKQGLTSSSDAGASIEFKLEDASNPDTLHQKQAKIIVKNGGASNTGNIHFQTANGSDSYNDRIVIKKDGDVGVGTNNPLGKLHLEVSAQYEEGFYISNAHATYGSDSDGGVYHFNHYNAVNTSARGLILQERNTTNVWKRNIMIWQRGTGNVGIDMVTPSSKLHIFDSTDADNKTVLIIQKGAATYGNSTSGPALEFKTFLTSSQASKNQARIRGIDDVVGNGDYGGLAFDYRKGLSSYVEGFRLSSDGYIGVNRSDPKVILDIDDTGAIQLPIGESDERPSSLRKGMVRYNTDTDQFEGYGAGNAWGSLGGVKDIDQDTYVTVSDGTTDTDEIKFWTQNNERMIIDPNGAVGIGISSPTKKLHVQGGDILIRGNDAAHKLLFQYWDNNSYFGSHSNAVIGAIDFQGNEAMTGDPGAVQGVGPHLNFRTYASIKAHKGTTNGTFGAGLRFYTHENTEAAYNLQERMCILPDGNVGINVTSPTAKLNIKGDYDTGHWIKCTYPTHSWSTTTKYNNTHFFSTESTGGVEHFNEVKIGPGGIGIGYNTPTYTRGGVDSLVCSGRVGIGTNSPTDLLTVGEMATDTGGTTSMSILAAGENADAILYFGTGRAMDRAKKAAIIAEGTSSYSRSKLHFCLDNTANNATTYNASISNSRMTIDTNGYVGIGKTLPGALLDVNGSMRAGYNANTNSYFGRAAIGYAGHSDYAGFSHLDRSGSTNYSFMSSSTGWTYVNGATNHGICFRINNTDKMRMNTSGHLGIGTTTPGCLLDVYGTAGGIQSSLCRFGGDKNFKLVAHGGGTTNATNQVAGAIGLYYTDSYENSMVKFHRGSGGTGGYMSFTVNNGSEKMRLNASGYLGIGKTNPGALLDVNGSMRAAYNANTASYFGRAAIGYVGHSDYAGFAHLDVNNTSSYALIQNYQGTTLLNAANGRTLHFRINNSDKATLTSSKFNVTASFVAHDVTAGNHLSAADGDFYVYDGVNNSGYTYQGAKIQLRGQMWIYSNYRYSYNAGDQTYFSSDNTGTTGNFGTYYHGIILDATSILMKGDSHIIIESDERVKKDIKEIPDNESLNKLRDISCVTFKKIDDSNIKFDENGKIIRPRHMGFIAQNVIDYLPNSVSLESSYIPNEFRLLDDISWEEVGYMTDISNNIKYKLVVDDLKDKTPHTMYKFFVKKQLFDAGTSINDVLTGKAEKKEEIEIKLEEDGSFLFDKKYDYVFIYGIRVEDFHALDYNSLYTLNFSATQQIDKIQRKEKSKLEKVETEVKLLKEHLEIVLSQNKMLLSRLENIESVVN